MLGGLLLLFLPLYLTVYTFTLHVTDQVLAVSLDIIPVGRQTSTRMFATQFVIAADSASGVDHVQVMIPQM